MPVWSTPWPIGKEARPTESQHPFLGMATNSTMFTQLICPKHLDLRRGGKETVSHSEEILLQWAWGNVRIAFELYQKTLKTAWESAFYCSSHWIGKSEIIAAGYSLLLVIMAKTSFTSLVIGQLIIWVHKSVQSAERFSQKWLGRSTGQAVLNLYKCVLLYWQ